MVLKCGLNVQGTHFRLRVTEGISLSLGDIEGLQRMGEIRLCGGFNVHTFVTKDAAPSAASKPSPSLLEPPPPPPIP